MVRQIISYFLFFCIAASAIPVSLFHTHNIDHECDSTNTEFELDQCHINIFHNSGLDSDSCEHKSHFDNSIEHCDFCEFVTPVTEQVASVYFSEFTNSSEFYETQIFISTLSDRQPRISFYDRGPPSS